MRWITFIPGLILLSSPVLAFGLGDGFTAREIFVMVALSILFLLFQLVPVLLIIAGVLFLRSFEKKKKYFGALMLLFGLLYLLFVWPGFLYSEPKVLNGVFVTIQNWMF